jgi:hypothetical protein
MRTRDQPIDHKIGATLRVQPLKLGMNQAEQLGEAIGVTFQQIQNLREGHKWDPVVADT